MLLNNQHLSRGIKQDVLLQCGNCHGLLNKNWPFLHIPQTPFYCSFIFSNTKEWTAKVSVFYGE